MGWMRRAEKENIENAQSRFLDQGNRETGQALTVCGVRRQA